MSAANAVPVTISESELRTLLLRYRRENWRGIQTPEIQERVVDDVLSSGCEQVLNAIAPFYRPTAGDKVLDIGSGVGSFVVGCRQKNLLAFGIEPDRIGSGATLTSLQIAHRRVDGSAFVSGVGERLPFADSSFHLVCLNQVVEHVSDQVAVLQEAARVVRPGGAIFVACPNYLRCYEPHYKVKWLPLMPYWMGRLYLRLRGRDPVMLDQLTYTTNRRLKRWLKNLGKDYVVLDLHREEFLRKLKDHAFAGKAGKLVTRFIAVPFAGLVVKGLALWFVTVREGGCAMVVLRAVDSPS
jgi:ubiquinone/menaquinone biosynthesis C-methylase UbiE